jgi:hypothetical protein
MCNAVINHSILGNPGPPGLVGSPGAIGPSGNCSLQLLNYFFIKHCMQYRLVFAQTKGFLNFSVSKRRYKTLADHQEYCKI